MDYESRLIVEPMSLLKHKRKWLGKWSVFTRYTTQYMESRELGKTILKNFRDGGKTEHNPPCARHKSRGDIREKQKTVGSGRDQQKYEETSWKSLTLKGNRSRGQEGPF